MNITELKPGHFTVYPMGSIKQSAGSQIVAQSINIIRERLGNDWALSWDQYKAERVKDGDFTDKEKKYFDSVIDLISSAEACINFSPSWSKVATKYLKA